jgi:hypothetical protein
VTISGCAHLIGSVAVDGAGGVSVGDCGNNLAYSPVAPAGASVYGDPTTLRSTWREL